METLALEAYLLPVALGIGLAAAVGFRVFLPLLVMGLAARHGFVPVGESFAWVAATPALTMLAAAALIETAAYYVPLLDNLLDTIAAPVAVIAGIAVSAAVMTDVPPMLKWTLAIIAGGGAAGLTQGATTLLRGVSTAATAGIGNPVVATGEFVAAIAVSVLAILAPWIAILFASILCAVAYRFVRRVLRRNSSDEA